MLWSFVISAGHCPNERHLKPPLSTSVTDGTWVTVNQKPSVNFKQNRGWWQSRGDSEGPTPFPAQPGETWTWPFSDSQANTAKTGSVIIISKGDVFSRQYTQAGKLRLPLFKCLGSGPFGWSVFKYIRYYAEDWIPVRVCRHGCGELHPQIQLVQECSGHLYREQQGGIWGENLTVSVRPWNILCWTLVWDGRGTPLPHTQHISYLQVMLTWDVCTELSYSGGSGNTLGSSGENSRALKQLVCCCYPCWHVSSESWVCDSPPINCLETAPSAPSFRPPLSSSLAPQIPLVSFSGILALEAEVKLDQLRMHSWDSSLYLSNHPEPCLSNPHNVRPLQGQSQHR